MHKSSYVLLTVCRLALTNFECTDDRILSFRRRTSLSWSLNEFAFHSDTDIDLSALSPLSPVYKHYCFFWQTFSLAKKVVWLLFLFQFHQRLLCIQDQCVCVALLIIFNNFGWRNGGKTWYVRWKRTSTVKWKRTKTVKCCAGDSSGKFLVRTTGFRGRRSNQTVGCSRFAIFSIPARICRPTVLLWRVCLSVCRKISEQHAAWN